jgi:uncharacterized protein with HEPN domain
VILDRERLLDILEAIAAIERRRPARRAEFDQDELIQVWCLRHLEIIGEAAANVSPETRALAPEIPWRQVTGMRNALIHAYFAVDWNAVWNVVERELEPLKANTTGLLDRLGDDDALV